MQKQKSHYLPSKKRVDLRNESSSHNTGSEIAWWRIKKKQKTTLQKAGIYLFGNVQEKRKASLS